MSKLIPITIACAEYDRTRAIKDGRVRVDGCEVTYLPLDPEYPRARFGHMMGDSVPEAVLTTQSVPIAVSFRMVC